MPRQPRRQSWTEAACFHILNRGHNRDTLFAEKTKGDRVNYFYLPMIMYHSVTWHKVKCHLTPFKNTRILFLSYWFTSSPPGIFIQHKGKGH
jgi:hypothetical protein